MLKHRLVWLIGGLVLVIIIGGVIFLRLSTAEDDWFCENGRWVRHGNPVADHPPVACVKDISK